MIAAAGLLLTAALAALLAGLVLGAVAVVAQGARAVQLTLSDGDAGTPPVSAGGVRSWQRVVHTATLAALVLLLAALASRAVGTGHAPWSNLHEFSAAFAAAVLASYALLERRHPLRPLVPVVAGIAAALVALSLALDDRAQPLVPALQQPLLLTVHVGSAVVAYALTAVAFAAALGELAQRRMAGRLAALPSAGACRAMAHRAALIAFPVLTLAIVLGSVWANLAWRSYWSNDPKELAAAATWLVYGAYLHVAGRRDRWSALAPWLIVLGFAGVLFTYLGAGLVFVGQHSYGAP